MIFCLDEPSSLLVWIVMIQSSERRLMLIEQMRSGHLRIISGTWPNVKVHMVTFRAKPEWPQSVSDSVQVPLKHSLSDVSWKHAGMKLHKLSLRWVVCFRMKSASHCRGSLDSLKQQC